MRLIETATDRFVCLYNLHAMYGGVVFPTLCVYAVLRSKWIVGKRS